MKDKNGLWLSDSIVWGTLLYLDKETAEKK